MSRTIVTNSGSDFLTNISAEQFIGEICRDIDVNFSHFYEPTDVSKSLIKMNNLADEILTLLLKNS